MRVLFSLLILSSCLVCAFGCPDYLSECSSCASWPADSGYALAEYCLDCNSGYFLSGHYCWEECADGEFFYQYSCTTCDAICVTCNQPGKCLTCGTSTGYPLAYNNYCYSTCPPSTFQSSTTTCQACPTFCESCTDNSYCSACKTGRYMYQDLCYDKCPPGTYGDASFHCQPCASPCATCASDTVCQSCTTGLLLYETQCLDSCPFGYYPSSGRCQVCPTNCAGCTGISACTSCKGNYLLSGGSCVTTCPVKTYPVLGVCTKCSDHCSTCGDGAICSACETGWYLFANICSDTCPTGFYKDNGACPACPAGCTNCIDATNCGACNNGYVFYQNTCPLKCPDGMYNAAGFCQDCETRCRICESERMCLQCKLEYVFFNKTCLITCPDGYYNLDGICTICPIGCTTCTSASFCQSCAYGYNLHMSDVCALDITEEEIEEVKGMAATTEATGTASNVLSSIYGFMNSGDPTAMFMGSLAKMLQYVKYINIKYPPKIKLMFGLQSNLNDTSESIITKTQKKIEDTSESPSLANNFGYYKLTSSFMSNCFQSLGILAGIVAGIGVNYLVLYLISPLSRIHQICKSLMGILKWNLFLLMFCGMIGDIVFFSSFEFRKANFENGFSVISFIACMLMNFLSIFVFYKLIQVNMNLQKSRNSRIVMRHEADFLKHAESKWESCKVFFDSYKNKKFSQQAFMIFFLIRVLSFYLTIAYFSAYPFFQIIMITIVSVLIITYLVIVRPFKSVLNNINQIVFELVIFAFNGCVLILAALETSNSDNYLLREKLEAIMLNINLAAGFISTAFVVLKAIVVAWDIYKDWKLKKKTKSPRKNWRKNRLANRITRSTNNNSTTNSDALFTLSSQNIINMDTMTIPKMGQTYDNQSFDISHSLNQGHLRNHNNNDSLLTSHTPSSSFASQGNHQRGLGSQEYQESHVYQRNQAFHRADLQPNNQRQRIKESSTSTSTLSSRRIQKRQKHFTNVAKQILQDGKVWRNKELASDLGTQTREYDPNKARIRRIQKQNKLNGIDIIGL